MYLGLFLAPWMLMYAASTVVMNHRGWFVQHYGEGPVPFQVEQRVTYAGSFPPETPPADIARLILVSLDLDGAHGVDRRANGAIVINRHDLVTPRRLTYRPADQSVVIEKMEARPSALLERFHRRRGYATGYGLDTTWAASVDLVIVAMVFWGLSGLWMWWEMTATRRMGAVAILTGAGLFVFYVFTL
jgi:hypothetical protein